MTVMCLLHDINMCLACATTLSLPLSLSPSLSLFLSLSIIGYIRYSVSIRYYQQLLVHTHTHTPSIMIMETLKQLYCNNNKKVTSSDSCIYWEQPHTHTQVLPLSLSLSLVRLSHNRTALLRYTYITRNCASINHNNM